MDKAVRQKLALTLLLTLAMSFVSFSHTSVASACTNSANYGSASWSVTLPTTGLYTIWTRAYAPNTTAGQFQLEVDGSTCWQVGGGQSANTWTWFDWFGGNKSQNTQYNFTSTGSHTLKIIGLQPGVLIDRIILLGDGETCSDNSSTPTGTGSNCEIGPTVTQTGSTPTATSTVTSGSTTPEIVSQNASNIAETTYIVDGKVVQKTKGAAALDTAKLTNGTHNVQAIVTLKNGETLSESQTIKVQNKPNILKITAITLIVLALFSAILLLLWVLIRKYTLSRHQKLGISSQTTTAIMPELNEVIIIKPDVKQDENNG